MNSVSIMGGEKTPKHLWITEKQIFPYDEHLSRKKINGQILHFLKSLSLSVNRFSMLGRKLCNKKNKSMKSDMSDSNINFVNISVPPSRVHSSFDIRCIFYKIEPEYLVSTNKMMRRYLKESENIRHSLTIFF